MLEVIKAPDVPLNQLTSELAKGAGAHRSLLRAVFADQGRPARRGDPAA